MLLFFLLFTLKLCHKIKDERVVIFGVSLPTLGSNNLTCRIITTKVSHNHEDFPEKLFSNKSDHFDRQQVSDLDFKLNRVVYTLEFMIKGMIFLFNN